VQRRLDVPSAASRHGIPNAIEADNREPACCFEIEVTNCELTGMAAREAAVDDPAELNWLAEADSRASGCNHG
jgi:hypothetical protein